MCYSNSCILLTLTVAHIIYWFVYLWKPRKSRVISFGLFNKFNVVLAFGQPIRQIQQFVSYKSLYVYINKSTRKSRTFTVYYRKWRKKNITIVHTCNTIRKIKRLTKHLESKYDHYHMLFILRIASCMYQKW